jgi:hypothetical protein
MDNGEGLGDIPALVQVSEPFEGLAFHPLTMKLTRATKQAAFGVVPGVRAAQLPTDSLVLRPIHWPPVCVSVCCLRARGVARLYLERRCVCPTAVCEHGSAMAHHVSACCCIFVVTVVAPLARSHPSI